MNFSEVLLKYSGLFALIINIIILLSSLYSKRMRYEIIVFADTAMSATRNHLSNAKVFDIQTDFYFVIKNLSNSNLNILYLEVIDKNDDVVICPLDTRFINMKWHDYRTAKEFKTFEYPYMTSKFPVNIPAKGAQFISAVFKIPNTFELEKIVIHTSNRKIINNELINKVRVSIQDCIEQSNNSSSIQDMIYVSKQSNTDTPNN